MPRSILAVFLAAAPALAGSGEPGVYWKGARHGIERLPVTMPAEARTTVQAWVEWSSAHELRLDLDDAGRLLLISPDSRSTAERRFELARRTLDLCDALLPPPSERLELEPEEDPGAPDPAGELPEDPDGPPVGAGLLHTRPSGRTRSTWGEQPGEPDSETAVLFVLRNPGEQEELIDLLVSRAAYLSSWAPEARKQVGFLLERPLCGAYLLDAPGMEEWNPDNELVNRLAQLFVLRRFGRQPYWVVQGFAWQVELRIQGAIYCFPYRDEFVFASEHTGWDKELARRYRAKKAKVDAGALTGWARGKYEDAKAKASWGMVGFLLHDWPEQVPDLLEKLRVTLERDSRKPLDGGGWERDRDYQLPEPRLEALLTEFFGDDVLARAGAWFRAGLPESSR